MRSAADARARHGYRIWRISGVARDRDFPGHTSGHFWREDYSHFRSLTCSDRRTDKATTDSKSRSGYADL